MGQKVALVLAGGGGTRLKPLSTPETPKQFLKLFGPKTIFKETIDRTKDFDKIIIVAPREFEKLVQRDIGDHNNIEIVYQPCIRNTGPAIALGIMRCKPDDTIVVFPCDHFIQGEESFNDSICQAIKLAQKEYIATISTKPRYPNTGFGYVLNNHFVEKPNKKEAEKLIKEGYQWNTGIYAFKASFVVDLYKQYAPNILRNILEENYEACPTIAFEKAISEKTRRVTNTRSDFIWDDVGTFSGLYHVIKNLSPKNLEYQERPWGDYQVLRDDDIYKMKLLTITAGEGISLQYHKHRTEIWHIIDGEGTYVNQIFDMDNPLETCERFYHTGDTIEIPVNNIHQITAKTETKVFEVQIGDYFGEDDIIRLYDKYNRQ